MQKDNIIKLNSSQKSESNKNTIKEDKTFMQTTKEKNISKPIENVTPPTEQLNNFTQKKNVHETVVNNTDYLTNPIYKKLLQFNEKQKKEKFNVEDLLKW